MVAIFKWKDRKEKQKQEKVKKKKKKKKLYTYSSFGIEDPNKSLKISMIGLDPPK